MESGNLRQEQAAVTKRKLLESAQKMFAEKGYKGTSVRSINQGVNLADGLLYHYFPGGKKEIFQAIVEENVKQLIISINNRISLEKCVEMPLEEALELAYVSFVDTIDNYLDIIRILLKENNVLEIITEDQLLRISGNKSSWQEELLRKKAERGEVKEMDFGIAAFSVNSILASHILDKIYNVGLSKLENPDSRKRIIKYQAQMWLISPT